METATGSPLVSIIIPAYNAEQSVSETLRSVLAQTYNHFEILIVDDGSTDSTAEIVESISKEDSRIGLIRQSNLGVAAARNLAIEKSQGTLIAPLDADDIWFERKLEKQVQCLLDAGPDAGLVYAWSVVLDESGNIIGRGDRCQLEGDVYLNLVFSNFIGNASAPLIRKSCLERVGAYRTAFRAMNAQGCEDWDLYLRIAEQYEFRVVPEELIGYRTTGATMSCDCRAMARSYAIVADTVADRHPELPTALLRWSRSKMYYFLLTKSCAKGDVAISIYWLYMAIRFDPLRLISVRVYQALVACLIRASLKPMRIQLREFRFWRRRARQRCASSGVREPCRYSRTFHDRLRQKRLAGIRRSAPRFARAWAT